MHTYSVSGRCHQCCEHITKPQPRWSYCRGGCGKLRPEYKPEWCKRCRKTEKYAKHLADVARYKEENAGLSPIEILSKRMKLVYDKSFFDALESTAAHPSI